MKVSAKKAKIVAKVAKVAIKKPRKYNIIIGGVGTTPIVEKISLIPEGLQKKKIALRPLPVSSRLLASASGITIQEKIIEIKRKRENKESKINRMEY
jgi:hypothetical protein